MVGLCLATPAAAIECNFTKECFEAEACTATLFDIEIDETEGARKIVTPAETVPVSLGGSDLVRIYVGVTNGAFHLLSRTADGAARYTNHLYQGPMVVSFLGTCKEPS